MLKPGGMLYLTTPNLKAARNIIRLIRKGRMPGDVYDCWVGAENDGMMGHIREYTPLEMATYLPKIGFTDVKVKTINVYEKAAFETLAWKVISFPFSNGKETIIARAFRPKG